MAWLCARVSAGSSWESNSPVPDTAFWLTLSGKPTQRPASWRGWKTRPWSTRLFGAVTSENSIRAYFRELTSSRAGIRANRFPTQASEQAPRTSATCGQRSPESSASASPDSASSRTSPAIYLLASRKSFPTWSDWATELRRVCSKRRKWVRRIDGSGCSSWQTPSDPTFKYRRQVRQTERAEELLPAQAENWATTHVTCATGAGKRNPDTGENLQTQAASHPAPPGTGDNWPTPNTWDHQAQGSGVDPKNNPKASSIKLSTLVEKHKEYGGVSGRRSLNPRFVEWLMGLPVGWTACVPAEMQSFQSWRHTHSRRLHTLLGALKTWDAPKFQPSLWG